LSQASAFQWFAIIPSENPPQEDINSAGLLQRQKNVQGYGNQLLTGYDILRGIQNFICEKTVQQYVMFWYSWFSYVLLCSRKNPDVIEARVKVPCPRSEAYPQRRFVVRNPIVLGMVVSHRTAWRRIVFWRAVITIVRATRNSYNSSAGGKKKPPRLAVVRLSGVLPLQIG
jgi:hypothetical protein